jgi:hypothetical protein
MDADTKTAFKPEPLVPIWIGEDGARVAGKLSHRPVLLLVETLGAVMHGEMLGLSLSQARVLPSEPILLWNNVRVKVRFRFADVLYSLSGTTSASHPDLSFSFVFDLVTREQIAILSSKLTDSGLLQAGELDKKTGPPTTALEPETKPQPPTKPKRIKFSRVRHDPPPAGIERRVHERHELEAGAMLVILDKGVSFKCMLLEVSLGGCRLYTGVPITYPEGTNVEVEFTGLGYPFRLAARIKVKAETDAIGLEFQQMSFRIKDRLSDMIHELAEKQTIA